MKSKFLPFYGYRLSIALLCLCSSPNLLLANTLEKDLATIDQNKITLSGTVSDESGPLPGVVVQVKSRNNATLSDHDGNYSIQVNQGDTVEFSYMGYITKNVTINNQENLNITLQQDSQQLDEIVVNAGYYTVKDRERTGSIARVTAKDIEHQPVINPLQAIQGRMAGVSITQANGLPGGGFNIEIRGRNSLRARNNAEIDGTQPLYIIDGVPILDGEMKVSFFSEQILGAIFNPLNSINPNDIESIEVLKDADATAIYGSRGANGVILITTKKAKNSKTQFNLSSSISFSKVANMMKMMNTEAYNNMREEAFYNDGVIDNYPSNAYDMNGAWEKNRYTNWQKELIGGTAVSQEISLGINGGSEQTRFKVNTSHIESNTVFPTDKGYKRNTLNSQFTHNSKNQDLQFSSSLNYNIQYNNLPYLDLTRTAIELAPNAPDLYNSEGGLNWQNGTFDNPLANLNKTYSSDNTALIFNTSLSYKIINNLFIKINSGITTSNLNEKILTPHTTRNPALGFGSETSKTEIAKLESKSYIVEPQVNWLRTLNNNKIDILFGGTFQSYDRDYFQITGSNFSSNFLMNNIYAAKNRVINKTANSSYKYLAFFGRLNYSYLDKYFINLTARRDGSSRFGPGKKFGNFGAIGIAWIFTKEKWFNDNSILNFGKIRSSYGTTGSDQIGDYMYLDTHTVLASGYDGTIGLTPTRLFNPNFSWEKTSKLEFALDLSFWNNKIETSFSWYKNNTNNQLVGLPLAITTGFPNVQSNLNASIQNTGFEFTLSSENIKNNNWSWSTSFNISFPKNKLTAFPNLEGSTYARQFQIGKSLNMVKLYEYLGIDQETGLYQYKDFNNDGKITATDDKIAVKEIGVKYHGGLQNTLTYKNFYLDFLLQFVKQDNYNFNKQYKRIGTLFNQPVEMNDRWSENNPYSEYAFATFTGNPQLTQLSTLLSQSTKTISDASYIRLKNISVNYNLSLPKAKINNIRIYFQAQNLFTITNYFGIDPEFINLGGLPPLKTYAFGIALTI